MHAAILVVQSLGPFPDLFNTVVAGKLYQFVDSDSVVPIDERYTADNLVDSNVVLFAKENASEDGITTSNALRTKIRNNTVGRDPNGAAGADGGQRIALRAGGIGTADAARQLPGTCGGGSRRCLSDFDCQLLATNLGSCGTLPAPIRITRYVEGVVMEHNTVFGPLHAGIGFNGRHASIVDNHIHGPFSSPIAGQPQGGMILEGKFVLETAVITGNTIDGCTGHTASGTAHRGGPAPVSHSGTRHDLVG